VGRKTTVAIHRWYLRFLSHAILLPWRRPLECVQSPEAIFFRAQKNKTHLSRPKKARKYSAPRTLPASAHLRLILREQKIFPATKESYRVYIGTRYHAPTPIQIAARVTMFPKRIVGRLISEYMAREKNTVFFMHQLANR
jgi:hypothetical protein